MLRLLSVGGVAILVGLAIASMAFGSVPDPTRCIVPGTAVVDPSGDLTTQITVNDASNNPIQGAVVVIDFSLVAAQGPHGAPAAPCLVACVGQSLTPSAVTNASGVATFALKLSNCCARNYQVTVGAVNIGQITLVVSLDNDGNGTVDLGDFINFKTKYNTVDVCTDYDVSGGVTALSDFIFFKAHYGHTC